MKDYQALKKKLKVPDNLTPHYDQVISPEEGRSLVSLKKTFLLLLQMRKNFEKRIGEKSLQGLFYHCLYIGKNIKRMQRFE